MIRYTCDRCKREIHPDLELRFVVRMEIEAAIDPNVYEEEIEDDHDHLSDVDEVLGRLEVQCDDFDEADIFQRRSFDLCPNCYRLFAKNPLGKDIPVPFGFSNN